MYAKSLIWAFAITAGIAGVSAAVDQAGPDYLKVRDLTAVKVLTTPQHVPVVLAADGQAREGLLQRPRYEPWLGGIGAGCFDGPECGIGRLAMH